MPLVPSKSKRVEVPGFWLNFLLTCPAANSIHALFNKGRMVLVRTGDGLQGAAADCNSAGVTHAWFDSRVAHHAPGKWSCYVILLT